MSPMNLVPHSFLSRNRQEQKRTPLEEGLPESVEITFIRCRRRCEIQYEADGVTKPRRAQCYNNWRYTWGATSQGGRARESRNLHREGNPIAGWEAMTMGTGASPLGIAEGTIQITNTKQSAYTLPETGGVVQHPL